MRKYSVAEIDKMRSALRFMVPLPAYSNDIERIAEDQLRTHMLNGTDPEDLVTAENEHWNKLLKKA